jgi:hypothetical protein
MTVTYNDIGKCEICKDPVDDSGQHWRKTKERPDGFWTCHPQFGNCRCAKCDHVWKPRKVRIPDGCPECSESDDLFWADDGVWEQAAREKREKQSRNFDL